MIKEECEELVELGRRHEAVVLVYGQTQQKEYYGISAKQAEQWRLEKKARKGRADKEAAQRQRGTSERAARASKCF